MQLSIPIRRCRFGPCCEDERGRAVQFLPRWIEAGVHRASDFEQSDRVDVVDRGGEGVIPHLRGVARNDDEVADAERVRAEQVGNQPEIVAVARADMKDRLDAGARNGLGTECEVGHARRCTWSVGDVDDVDSSGDGVAGESEGARWVGSRGRAELDRDRELTAGDSSAEKASFGEGDESWTWCDDRRLGVDRHGSGARRTACHHPDRAVHRADMIRRRAAAAADQLNARLEHATGEHPEVLRVGHIDRAAVDDARQPGVRLDRDRHALADHSSTDVVQLGRPESAVAADDVCTGGNQPVANVLGTETLDEGIRVEDHLRDSRQFGSYGAGRLERPFELDDRGEGLEHEQVDAGLDQRLDLFT